jgi:multicomponent Na+:H+ antiporter subunit B
MRTPMGSLILSSVTSTMLPILLIFSVFLLLRGHNAPGGGFVGGLVASAAFALYAFADGPAEARATLRIGTKRLMGGGLLVALSAGLAGPLVGQRFFEGLWPSFALPVVGKLGTPLLFDVGVYFVVVGVSTTVIFTLMED